MQQPPTQQPYQDDAPQLPNPWVTIWTAPRATVRIAAEFDPRSWLWLLVAVGGLSRVLSRVSELPLESTLPTTELLFALLVAGPVAGAMLVWVAGRLLHVVLVRMGCVGTWIASRTAIVWSLAPGVPSLALWLIMLASYGPRVLAPGAVANSAEAATKFILSIDYFIQFALTMWMLVLEILTLADVHKLTPWRALLAEVIVGLGLLAVAILVLLMV